MEHERTYISQEEWAPMRTLPMFRRARRPRRPVFRVPMDYDTYAETYEYDWTDDMDRHSPTNEYDYDMSFEQILADFKSDEIFSDYQEEAPSHLFEAPEDVPPVRPRYDEPIDSRFRLSRDERSSVKSSRVLDQSADEEYDYKRQDDFVPTYNEDELDYDYEYSYEEPEESKGRSLFGFRRKKNESKRKTDPKYVVERLDEEKIYEESFRDVTGDLSRYAKDRAYGEYAYDEDYEAGELEAGAEPPSFSEYVASLFASVFLRIKGSGSTDTSATMSDSDEDLGKEVSYEQAYKYYCYHDKFSSFRARIALFLVAALAYISFGFPLPGMLAYPPVTAAMCLAIQFTVMLLGLDVVTTAILNAARLRLGADTLAVISCIVTSIDAIVIITSKSFSHVPLCALSSLSLLGVMYSSSLTVSAFRKVFRVPHIADVMYTVTGENNVGGRDATLLKSTDKAEGFIRRTEEAPVDETLFCKLSPMCLALALLLSFIVAFVTKSFHEFTFILSSVLAPAVPVTALLCFAYPFFLGTMKIFHKGLAIAGWSGLCDVGRSSHLIVTDSDLFPDGTVEIESVIAGEDVDFNMLLSYTGSMMLASGCSAGRCFAKEMENSGVNPVRLREFEPLSGGGMKAIIEGHTVLCGSNELMRLMNVRFPYNVASDGYPVMLAVDGEFLGLFKMRYRKDDKVRKALVELMRSNRHPIFAPRDFNISPRMLKDIFDIATDGYDFPPFAERFKITEAKPGKNSKVAAVVCKEGLSYYTTMADTGRSVYMATRINLMITAVSAVLGMLVVFLKILTTGTISASFVLMYMLITALPVLIVSVFMK